MKLLAAVGKDWQMKQENLSCSEASHMAEMCWCCACINSTSDDTLF